MQASTWARCENLLQGVPFKALRRYASTLCHNLTHLDALHCDLDDLHTFHTWLIDNMAPSSCKARLLENVGHRRAYRGHRWVLTDQHRAANLVTAYVKANASPPEGDGSGADYQRLFDAQLVVNDLVSVASEPSLPTSVRHFVTPQLL